MELPNYGLLSKWLILYGENIAVAMIVVGLYAAVRPAVLEERPRLASVAIGVMFGLCAIISMSFPISVSQHVFVDMRNVFALVGGLSGGPLGAAVATVIAIAFRIYLGGVGAIIGVGGIVIAALIGGLVARHYGPRVREFGVGQLIVVGLAAALANHLWGRALFIAMGLTPLPLEPVIATILLYPAGTIVLVTVVNATGYRVWHRTQRQLLNIYETTSDLIWETDTVGRFTLISGRITSMTGYEPSDILGKTVRVFGGNWQDDATRDIFRRATLARLPFDELKFQSPAKDGSLRTVSVSGRPAFDSDGRFSGYRGVAADITGRQRAETALEAREAHLREIERHLARAQEIGSVASTEIDFRTGQAYWSENAYSLFGVERGSVVPSIEAFLPTVHPDDLDRVRAIVYAASNGKDTPPTEFRVVHTNGDVRWLYRVAEIIRDDDGNPIRVIATTQDITERKRVEAELRAREEQLRRSEERLARAQQVGHVGSIDVDLATETAIWSDEMYRLVGKPIGSGSTFEDFEQTFHPDDRPALREDRLTLARGETLAPREYRILLPDGTIRWLYRQVEVIRDDTGKPIRHLSSYLDVTESKNAALALEQREAELMDSRERLALAQEVAALGSIQLDYADGSAHWSEEVFRITGLDPASTTPSLERFRDLVHRDDLAVFDRARDEARSGIEPAPAELRIVRPDGQVRWIFRLIRLIRDARGVVTKSIATLQDITDRKQMENELRQNREHLALAQRVGMIGSSELDLESGRLQWSDEWYAIIGRNPAEFEPTTANYLSVIHPDDQPAARNRIDRSVQGLPNAPTEYRVVRPNGEIRWVYARTDHYGQFDRAGKIIGIIQDITDRKRAQAERAELERQLLQAQKMEAIGNLTGGIAHDFNNLLSVILGRLDMAMEELGDRPRVREWIEICIKAADRGATLTRSMLAFSRQQPLQPVDIDVAAAISDVMGILPRTLGETIAISVSRAPELWSCHADPVQLQNAVLNLALNARDAMPNGGKLTIEISNARLDADYAARNADVTPGDYVALSMSDTGTGMTPEVAARAFDPFFTTKDVGKGSGLGLSMVYGFVRQSGGHVKIYTELGSGTTVRLYLPRGHTRRTTSGVSAGAAPLRTGHETILVVEDDADVRDLTVAMLRRLGYAVLFAADGTEALGLIATGLRISVLLTDVTLPGGANGKVLAQKVAEIVPSVRAIFMSGYAQSAIFGHGHLEPGVQLLQKPFTIEQLSDALRSVLDAAD